MKSIPSTAGNALLFEFSLQLAKTFVLMTEGLKPLNLVDRQPLAAPMRPVLPNQPLPTLPTKRLVAKRVPLGESLRLDLTNNDWCGA